VEKVRRGFHFWFTFVLDPRVPQPTTLPKGSSGNWWFSERYRTLRNGRGIRIYEILPPLLRTWKRRGLNPQEELSKALMRAWATLRKL